MSQCLEGTWHMLPDVLDFWCFYSIELLPHVSYKPKWGSVLGRTWNSFFFSMSWSITASESILTADRCQALSLSLPLSSTSGQTNKKTHMLPFLVTAESSVHTSHSLHRNPDPSRTLSQSTPKSVSLSSSASGHFQICLGACPALPGKPHRVRNKAFHTLDVCAVPPD